MSKISFTKSIFIESKKVCYFIANNLFFMLLLEMRRISVYFVYFINKLIFWKALKTFIKRFKKLKKKRLKPNLLGMLKN